MGAMWLDLFNSLLKDQFRLCPKFGIIDLSIWNNLGERKWMVRILVSFWDGLFSGAIGYNVSFKECSLQAISQLPCILTWKNRSVSGIWLSTTLAMLRILPSNLPKAMKSWSSQLSYWCGNGGGDERTKPVSKNENPHQQKSRTKIQDGVNTCLFWKLKNSWILMIWCVVCFVSSSLVHFQPF